MWSEKSKTRRAKIILETVRATAELCTSNPETGSALTVVMKQFENMEAGGSSSQN